jgi:hypothetical protein
VTSGATPDDPIDPEDAQVLWEFRESLDVSHEALADQLMASLREHWPSLSPQAQRRLRATAANKLRIIDQDREAVDWRETFDARTMYVIIIAHLLAVDSGDEPMREAMENSLVAWLTYEYAHTGRWP